MTSEGIKVCESYERVFSSEDGKVVLEDLKKFCYYDATTHVKGDPTTSSRNEGMRCVIIEINGMIEKLIEARKSSKAKLPTTYEGNWDV